MPEMTVEQRDELLKQNAANLQRQADSSEKMLAAFNEQAAQLMSKRGELYIALYRFHFEQRKTALSTATSDSTLSDIVRDAIMLTDTAMVSFDAGGLLA